MGYGYMSVHTCQKFIMLYTTILHFIICATIKKEKRKKINSGLNKIWKKNLLLHLSKVFIFGSVHIAGLSITLSHEKSCICKEDKGQTKGRDKDLNWRKTRISDYGYRFHKLHK